MNKPFFGNRRNASVGAGNLGDPRGVGSFNNILTQEALMAALAACCAPQCGPNGQVAGGGMGGSPNAALAQAVASGQPQRCRRTVMPITKFQIAAGVGQTGTSNSTPANGPFRGLRLVVPSDVSPAGDLIDLKIQSYTQISPTEQQAGIPLRIFDQTSQDSGFIDMDWADSNSPITIVVANKFNAQFPYFEGAFEGLQLVR